MKDLQAVGLACTFCYVAPWSVSLIFIGYARFTNVIADMAEQLIAAIG